jgi:murein DD-endopeptidase MepM/ murein hydrolase activator NlpD
VTTASTTRTTLGHLRMLALAGTVALGAIIPAAPATLASYDETPASSSSTTTRQPDQFDIPADGGLTGLTAIVNTGTGGADMRTDPAHDADVLQRLPDGTLVNLRVDVVDTVYDDDGATRWWPVNVNGQDGWISGFYLVDPQVWTAQQATAEPTSAPSQTPATVQRVPFDFDFTGDPVAEVSADGDGLVMRSEPDAASASVTMVPEGAMVNLRIDQLDTVYDAQGTRWWPVEFDGAVGWVSGFYLITPGTQPAVPQTPAPAPTVTPSATAPAEEGLEVGNWAIIRTPNGNGVNLFSAPNAESGSTGFAPNNGLVQILEVAGTGWFQVRWDDQTGYIDGALLTKTQGPRLATSAVVTPTPAPTQTPVTGDPAQWVEGNEVQVQAGSGVGINMRSSNSITSERVGFLDNGAIVEVTAGPLEDDAGDAWYAVTDGDQSGWVRSDLVGDVRQAGEDAGDEAPGTADPTSGFILPVQNFRFTQDFGCSSLGFYSYDPSWDCSVHDGVDLAASSGTPLVAVQDGTVVAAGWCDCGLGYYVEIDHGGGLHTVYGHMASQPTVSVGQTVSQGTTIGPVGSTGLSTGPHVHFMVRLNGVTQDPKNYLPPI